MSTYFGLFVLRHHGLRHRFICDESFLCDCFVVLLISTMCNMKNWCENKYLLRNNQENIILIYGNSNPTLHIQNKRKQQICKEYLIKKRINLILKSISFIWLSFMNEIKSFVRIIILSLNYWKFICFLHFRRHVINTSTVLDEIIL